MFAKTGETASFYFEGYSDANRFDFKGEKGVRAKGCLNNF